MRVFVPQPIHGGFLSQMMFLFPNFEWILEGSAYIWRPALLPSSIAIDELFDTQNLIYSGKSIDEVDLNQYDMILTVIETHYHNSKLRATTRPIVWRDYYSVVGTNYNGPVVYSSKFIKNISSSSGEVIYETRNPDTYNGWTGTIKSALVIAASLKRTMPRYVACGGPTIEYLDKLVPIKMVVGNQPIKKNELISLYKSHRVYVEAAPDIRRIKYARVFSGSFIEAMMCGMPTVVTNTNEFGMIIDHGTNGYKCDKPEDMVPFIKALLQEDALAKSIGMAARAKALEIFNPIAIRRQWEKVFKMSGAII